MFARMGFGYNSLQARDRRERRLNAPEFGICTLAWLAQLRLAYLSKRPSFGACQSVQSIMIIANRTVQGPKPGDTEQTQTLQFISRN